MNQRFILAVLLSQKTEIFRLCDKLGKSKVHHFYRHGGSVQAVRPVGGVEV